MTDFCNLFSSILSAEGAIVEPVEPDGIEVLAPKALQQALSIPEWTRLGFGAELPDQALRVSLESDWIERLSGLLGERGSLLFISLGKDLPAKPSSDPGKLLKNEMVMGNATYRLKEMVEARTRYLLLTFRLTAISDEKRDDILHLGINESNSIISDDLVDPLFSYLNSLKETCVARPEDEKLPAPWTDKQVRDFVKKALPGRIRTRFTPFLSGMERRMGKDMDRLYTYHTDLQNEAAKRLEDKKAKGADEKDLEKEQMKFATIKREYQAKVADLGRKYAIHAEFDLVSALRLTMPVYRFNLLIMRRKGKRELHLDYNPISRRLETLPCEKCLSPSKPHLVCDDSLHLLCPACMSPCPSCDKTYCRACYPAKCPKCGH